MSRTARFSAIRTFTFGALPLIGLLACDSPTDTTPAPVPVASIEVTGSAGGVIVGQTIRLEAVVRAADGSPLNRDVAWATSDTVLATISASGLLSARAAGVAEVSAAADGKQSTVSITIRNTAPAISGLDPSSAASGSGAFELSVTGSGFASGATVFWNGEPRTTRVISTTEVRADIAAADLENPGLAEVIVANPGEGDGPASQRLHFMIDAPVVVPTITGLLPAALPSGSVGFELTVAGTGFVPGATVRWNGQPRTTIVISDTEVRASIPASDLVSAGSAALTVLNPASAGGRSSDVRQFTILPRITVPVIHAITPGDVLAGSAGFQLQVIGSGFETGAVVRWNGQPRATVVISGTEVRASIPASDLVSAGNAALTVLNPASAGGRSSDVRQFTILPRITMPVIHAVSPGAVRAGSPGFQLEVLGSGFVAGAVVHWNGQPRTTRVLDSTEVWADIPASDVTTTGLVMVTVVNPPAPGGATSLKHPFTILPPAATPLVTYRLVGLQSGEALPVEVSRNDWVDSTGTAHASTQYLVEGTFQLRYEPNGDSWEETVTIVRYLAGSNVEVRRDTFVNHGAVEYDPVTGMPRLRNLWGGIIPVTVLSDQQIVLYQTYDTTGRIPQKKAWLFVRQ